MTLSVKTFKRLILLVLALLIIIPSALAIHYGQKSAALEKQLRREESAVPAPSQQAEAGGEAGTEYLLPVSDPIDYETLYPELYGVDEIGEQRVRDSNTVYLTFDTSLNSNTGRILDVLAQNDVRATFFVTGGGDSDSAEILKRIVEEGHSVGVGSYSGSYQQIYSSVADYLADFRREYDLIYEAVGIRPQIFRFPGGSINSYNSGIYREIISEMLRRRFIFFDWNVSGEDTRIAAQTGEQIRDNVLAGMTGKDRGIVFLQDGVGKETVVDAVPGIIESLRSQGFGFEPLTVEVLPVVFSYQSAP